MKPGGGEQCKCMGVVASSSKSPESITTAMEKAKAVVSSNPVVVFSKTYCPYCTQVKQLLSRLGAKTKVVELDTESDGADIQSALKEWTGQRTVPNVFIGGTHIGGCDVQQKDFVGTYAYEHLWLRNLEGLPDSIMKSSIMFTFLL